MIRAASRLVFLTLALCVHTVFAQDLSDVEMKATHVAGNVYMLEGRGGNIGVSVGEDGILIVDDQFEPLADKIRASLKELGKGKLKFVLNTHWHADHTGGNVAFGPEAPIIAHTNVRNRLSTRQEVLNRVSEPSPKQALPVITFDDSLSIHFNDEEIKVVHFPHGHTDGDSVIFFTGSNVVHMGDDFFTGRFPFVDLGSGGNVQGLIENIGKAIQLLPVGAKIIPGHGPLSTPDDLKSYLKMLEETTAFVRSRMAKGKTLEEIQNEGLPEKWSSWQSGFIRADRWIQIIHSSYQGGT